VDVNAASWLVILLAIAAANLPFFNDKLFALVPVKKGGEGKTAYKPLFWRLLELAVLYFVVGAIALALEARLGNSFTQTWEFYAISACTFIVLAFPGFVLRYLRKRH
jgi:hypothetical protein